MKLSQLLPDLTQADIEIQGLNDADGGNAFAIATFLANEQEKDDPIEKFLREVGRGTAQGR